MNDRLEILLVEDDENECKELICEIDNTENFFLVGVTDNSQKAFELVKDTLPDVVILDLELHRGGGDGLDFLKRLKSVRLPISPFILVTTNNISSVIHIVAREYGADFIMTKNQDNYSAKSVIEFLKITKSAIKSNAQSAEVAACESTPTLKAQRRHRFLTNELNKVYVSTKAKGYNYLIEAILIADSQTVTQICNEIGKKYNKTGKSVERAMQNAIDRAWKSGDLEELLKHFTARIGSGTGVPSLTEFIWFYANKLKDELM